MSRGLFLSLDGPDGSGKSTQCQLLADWLRGCGRTVTICQDPGSTKLSLAVRSMVLENKQQISPWSEALLFMASRAQLVHEVIRPALERNEIVICDRYLLSTVVYQGHAGGLPPQTLWEIGAQAADFVLPDATWVLDLPVELAASRRKAKADRIESRSLDYHQKVRDGFLTEASRRPNTFLIDAGESVSLIHLSLQDRVSRVLERRKNS